QAVTLVMLISRTYDAGIRALHERLPQLGFTDLRPVHCTNVFRVIDPAGNRPGELARRAGVSPQAMAEFVRYLEGAGYLERTADPQDGRARMVVLTDRGRQASAAARQAFADLEATWVERIGAERLTELRATLAELAGSQPDPGPHLGRP
ncbi:MAG TPA: MarR family transcriptional regulator, partial [Kineosporiaceae bacterium]|nr:MarR family transcriptional regulator [Kineosporiaceae bacterium]